MAGDCSCCVGTIRGTNLKKKENGILETLESVKRGGNITFVCEWKTINPPKITFGVFIGGSDPVGGGVLIARTRKIVKSQGKI